MIKNYHIISKGGESTIYKISSIDNYVIKVSNTNNNNHIIKELNAIKLLKKHSNIIDYIKFDKKNIIYFPYYEQDLCSYIIKKTKIPYNECINIFYKVIDAVDFMHSLGLIHCDIKPENILLDKNLEPKLIDFGHLTINKSFYKKGSLYYNSPEMCLGKMYDYRTDLWSLGILLYLMFYGIFPFDNIIDTNTIISQIIYFSKKIPKKNINIYKIISSLLVINPDKRESLTNIKKMECFNNFYKINYYNNPIHVPKKLIKRNIVDILNKIGWKKYNIEKQLSIKTNKIKTDIMLQRSYFILNQMCY